MKARIPVGWTIAYYAGKARYELMLGDVRTAWWFVRLGWRVLRGKLLVMDIQDSTARGGYKYRVLVLSTRPVSADATYDF